MPTSIRRKKNATTTTSVEVIRVRRTDLSACMAHPLTYNALQSLKRIESRESH